MLAEFVHLMSEGVQSRDADFHLLLHSLLCPLLLLLLLHLLHLLLFLWQPHVLRFDTYVRRYIQKRPINVKRDS